MSRKDLPAAVLVSMGCSVARRRDGARWRSVRRRSEHIPARLQALANPGGVCVSGATYEQVRKVLPVAFADMGLQQVKNIEDPIRAYATRELACSEAVAEDSLRLLPRQAVHRCA